ncbi:GNAT family N-acetyltransferase [Marivirga sp.]|uniref:GNAT family N-acetyltransferase n=1 Tax=Marivirga sp. TaxID=2018662 RepID=UPI0025CBA375|nr:GNAT family N-acetyltransferase [Marivirga sp.]
MTFSIIDKKAISPYRAPLGGLNQVGELPIEIIEEFIYFTQQKLKNEGISLVVLNFAPFCYSHRLKKQIQTFLKCGWEIDNSDVGLFLELKNKSYWQSIDPGSKNRLNKAKKAGFYCKKIHVDELDSAYKILVSNRIRNDFPITMKFEDLNFMCQNFKEYELFAAYDDEKMISMAVCIQVSDKISYLFYLADLHEYRSFSPNILMLNYIYDHYLEAGFEILDLGVVSEKSVINRGLFDFKKNLGGSTSKKYGLIKYL